MHSHSLDGWTHEHVYLGRDHDRNARRTWLVVALTAVMMVAEIVGGIVFGSMALLADGWHMATHAAALGISGFAYLYARRHAHDRRFAFGTAKLGDLAAFASAIVLAMIAILIVYESAMRLVQPVSIAYSEAMAVAVAGLAVNLVSAWLLRERDHHGHGAHDHHGHDHDHHHGHHHGHAHGLRDNNLRSAYLHVLADASTSVMAIVALVAAGTFGWVWVDPAVALVGSGVIAYWAYGLIRDAGAVLLDVVPDRETEEAIRERLERSGDRVADLHLWQVGPGHRAAVISIVTHAPQPAEEYKRRLEGIAQLSHVTVEVLACR